MTKIFKKFEKIECLSIKSKKQFRAQKNSVIHHQTFFGSSWGWKNLMTITVGKIEKNCKFYQTIAKSDVKLFRTIPLPPETMQQPSINQTLTGFSDTWGEKPWTMTINVNKFKKLCQQMLKLVMLKSWKTFHYIYKLCSNPIIKICSRFFDT